MTTPMTLTAVLMVVDLSLILIFFRLYRRSRSAVYKHIGLIHFCYVLIHLYGTFFSFEGVYMGVAQTDAWGEAFWRNRIFDLSLTYLFGSSLLSFSLLKSNSARTAFRRVFKTDRLYIAGFEFPGIYFSGLYFLRASGNVRPAPSLK